MYDVTDPNAWGPAIDEAVNAVRRGGLVVLPTDTVYGVGAEAFDAAAVAAIRTAKGRDDATPPPVLVPDVRTLDGLATEVSADARALAEAFWPGPLTLVLRAQPSLQWDLGDSRGTVALRVPDHPAALALLRRTGPLAVTGAQRVGEPAPLDADAARAQLGDAVTVYLDGGPVPGGASTVVDATVVPPRLVRDGAVTLATLREVVPALRAPEPDADDAPAADGSVPDADDAAEPAAEAPRAAETPEAEA